MRSSMWRADQPPFARMETDPERSEGSVSPVEGRWATRWRARCSHQQREIAEALPNSRADQFAHAAAWGTDPSHRSMTESQ